MNVELKAFQRNPSAQKTGAITRIGGELSSKLWSALCGWKLQKPMTPTESIQRLLKSAAQHRFDCDKFHEARCISPGSNFLIIHAGPQLDLVALSAETAAV